MKDSFFIVGLGNPGRRYEKTRHNLGFMVLEKIAAHAGARFANSSFAKAAVAQGIYQGHDLFLIMPMTYMNNSGVALARLREAQFSAMSAERILVICDDLSLPFGQVRIRKQGSDGGHNGLSSVIYHLQTDQFARLRMGIGQSDRDDPADYVLSEFTDAEQKDLDLFCEEASKCCFSWMTDGMDRTMEKFNRKKG